MYTTRGRIIKLKRTPTEIAKKQKKVSITRTHIALTFFASPI